MDATDRMKPLDTVKILMGIYSDRANVKRFAHNPRLWAKFQEYDYEDVFKVAQTTVNQFYLDMISGNTGTNSLRESTTPANEENG